MWNISYAHLSMKSRRGNQRLFLERWEYTPLFLEEFLISALDSGHRPEDWKGFGGGWVGEGAPRQWPRDIAGVLRAISRGFLWARPVPKCLSL